MSRTVSFVALIAIVIAVGSGQVAWGQIPQTISYQGVLADASGTAVPDGNYNLIFKLYSVASGGSALWTESQSVATHSGNFNVVLGSATALTLPFDQPYWLGMVVGSEAEMTPRIQLTASAYGLNSRTIVDNAVSTAKIQDGAVTTNKLAANAVTNAKLADNGVTSGKIAGGQVVKGLNSLKDEVTLAAGSNVTITPSGNTLTIAATPGGGGGDITAVNCGNGLTGGGDTGDVTLHVGAGSGINVSADAVALNTTFTDGRYVEEGQANAVSGAMLQDGAVANAKVSPSAAIAGTKINPDFGAQDLVTTGRAAIGSTNFDANLKLRVEGSAAHPSGIFGLAHYGGGNIRPFGVYASCVSSNAVTTGGGFYSHLDASQNPNISYLFGGTFGVTVDDPVNARAVTASLDGPSVDAGDYAVEILANDPGYAIFSPNSGKTYLNGNVGIGLTSPTEKLQVGGIVHSTSGGFKFPDGSVQTSAATGGTGDITSVNAGNGLIGGASSGDATLNIGAGTGINVTADAVELNTSFTDGRYVNESQANSVSGAMILDGAVTDADVAPAAAIAGTKITPNFGAQNIVTTGQAGVSEQVQVSSPGYTNRNFQMRSTAAQRLSATNDLYIDYGSVYMTASLQFTEGTTERMRIHTGGNVGIGTGPSPIRILTIKQGGGRPIADGWDLYSSRRWKTNIQPVANALEKVQRLRGVSFDWKADNKHDIGLIAEEVGEVIPEVVGYEANGTDATSVDYARLVAVLVEAVKEQQNDLNQQKAKIESLTRQIALLEESSRKTD